MEIYTTSDLFVKEKDLIINKFKLLTANCVEEKVCKISL